MSSVEAHHERERLLDATHALTWSSLPRDRSYGVFEAASPPGERVQRAIAEVTREHEQTRVRGVRTWDQFRLLRAVDEVAVWRNGHLRRFEPGQRGSRCAPINAPGVDAARPADWLGGRLHRHGGSRDEQRQRRRARAHEPHEPQHAPASGWTERSFVADRENPHGARYPTIVKLTLAEDTPPTRS